MGYLVPCPHCDANYDDQPPDRVTVGVFTLLNGLRAQSLTLHAPGCLAAPGGCGQGAANPGERHSRYCAALRTFGYLAGD